MTTLVIVTDVHEAEGLVRWGHRLATARGSGSRFWPRLGGRELATFSGFRSLGHLIIWPGDGRRTLQPTIWSPRQGKPLSRVETHRPREGLGAGVQRTDVRASSFSAPGAEPEADTGSGDASVDAAVDDFSDVSFWGLVTRKRLSIEKVIKDVDPSLLIVGYHRPSRQRAADRVLSTRLFEMAPCDTLMLRPGKSDSYVCNKVLVPAPDSPDVQLALRLGADLMSGGGTLVPLYVEPDADEVSTAVGEQVLARTLKNANLVPGTGALATDLNVNLQTRVVLGDDVTAGIRQAVDESVGLLLLGDRDVQSLRRRLFSTAPEHLLTLEGGAAVGVVRRGRPRRERLREGLERFLSLTFPQLRRQERVNLF